MILTFQKNLEWVPIVYEGLYHKDRFVFGHDYARNVFGRNNHLICDDFLDYYRTYREMFDYSTLINNSEIYIVSSGFLGYRNLIDGAHFLSTLAVLLIKKDRFTEIKNRILNSRVINNLDVKLVISKSFSIVHSGLYEKFEEIVMSKCRDKSITIEAVDNFDFIFDEYKIDETDFEKNEISSNIAGVNMIRKKIALINGG